MVKKYAELYLEARRRLRPTEGENAGNVARELVCAASGKTPEQMISDRELYAAQEIGACVEAYLERCLAGEPMPYILGQWDFYDMTLTVTPDVLIPRDDTMVVTDLAVKKALFLEHDPRILDLCTGSGCQARARRARHAGRSVSGGAARGAEKCAAAAAQRPRDLHSARRAQARNGVPRHL